LDSMLAGREPAPAARRAFALPVPRIAAGTALAEAGARAMLDISDGLGGDAAHLAAASGVRLVIEVERLPAAARVSVLDAAAAGEDYELLAAMPPDFDAHAAAVARRAGVPLTRVGRIEAGEGAVFLHSGAPVQVAGWDHFAVRPPPRHSR